MTPLVFGSARMFIDAAAAQRDEIAPVSIDRAAFGLPQAGPDCRISNWQGSVSENPSLFTTRCSLTYAQSPFGVNRVTLTVGRPLPDYPDQRTSSDRHRRSGWCHCDMGGDLHLFSAQANLLELLDGISGAEFLIFARKQRRARQDVVKDRNLDDDNGHARPENRSRSSGRHMCYVPAPARLASIRLQMMIFRLVGSCQWAKWAKRSSTVMLLITTSKDFKIGDTAFCQVGSRHAKVTWRDADTLVIDVHPNFQADSCFPADNEYFAAATAPTARHIFQRRVSGDLQEFSCGDDWERYSHDKGPSWGI
jgi:hypothetical protein